MQLGFVIDHSRCIGCHACTVACKAENSVPVGSFRTWVKYTESGSFPAVKRSFSVLRCNQCSNAPCVTICPVGALGKRADGIVDIDPDRCIGCKGCLQACPYDALYVNDATGTAEKCHFCAHRTEIGLAPACAVVCPTEAIIPGDFHDPASRVSQMKATGELSARKLQAGTVPNVYYKEVAPAGIDPGLTNTAGGFLWAEQLAGSQLDAQRWEATAAAAASPDPGIARTVYDVNHLPAWGSRVSAYLFTKSIAAGLTLAAAALWWPGPGAVATGSMTVGTSLMALVFLLLTTGLLIADLKRPDRFWYILRYPNWNSWIAKGTVALTGYGALLSLWIGIGLVGGPLPPALRIGLFVATAVFAVVTAGYTAELFHQAKGRALWMKRGLWLHLIAQAGIGGSAMLLALQPLGLGSGFHPDGLRLALGVSLLAHLLLVQFEDRMAPSGREAEYHRATALLVRGPYAKRHWIVAVGVGGLVPMLLLLGHGVPWLWVLGAILALVGLYVYEDNFVRAGQALPIS